jgi:acyl-CoA synthetase (AMP-forming)/AMP-acid ligase II
MNLVELLRERAERHPDRPAIIDFHRGLDRSVSFRELWQRVAEGSAFLKSVGLGRGKTVLAFHPVSIELYEFLLSAFHAGARVMLADPSAGKAFLSLCCRRQMPDGFFGSTKAQLLRWIVPELRSVKTAIRRGIWFPGSIAWKPVQSIDPPCDVPDEEPALITFTSGSTGVPKAAVRTHGFLLAQHAALSKSLDFEEGEVDLITLPVFVLANLASGVTSVLAATDLSKPGNPSPGVILQCERIGASRCAASPAFYEGLLKSGLPRFRKVYTGGAPVFPDLLRRLGNALPNASIEAVYGSTEAEPIAHISLDEDSASLTRAGGGLLAGLPVPGIGLKILRDQWGTKVGPLPEGGMSDLEVDQGQAGEIVVSGEHVLRGYLDGVGDEETKIHEGGKVWHRTGDAGWVDAGGRVWLLGRCAEKLPPAPAPESLPIDAFRYPFAIECALREWFPDIRMAALEWKGERMLVVGKIVSEDERKAIEEKARTFSISNVRYLKAMPLDRRHQAKIDYPALRKLL